MLVDDGVAGGFGVEVAGGTYTVVGDGTVIVVGVRVVVVLRAAVVFVVVEITRLVVAVPVTSCTFFSGSFEDEWPAATESHMNVATPAPT